MAKFTLTLTDDADGGVRIVSNFDPPLKPNTVSPSQVIGKELMDSLLDTGELEPVEDN